MKDRDVTALVDYGLNDDEFLPLIACVCGEKHGLWDFVIGMGNDIRDAQACPKCGRKLYFTLSIRVFEVVKP